VIPDDAEDDTIDFAYFYFVGAAKLNLTFKQIGRLTVRAFNRLYKHYKDNWSLEMRMTHRNMTYDELERKARENEDLF